MTLRRVGINAVFLRPRMGGLETYVRSLMPELVRLRPDVSFVLFLGERGRDSLSGESWLDEVEVATHPLLGRQWLTALSELTLLGALADRRRVDVLHSVPMTGPLRVRAAHVDLIGDLTWLHDPASVGPLTATLWRCAVPPVARRAQRILTFSEASRVDVAQQFAIPRKRIDVVPLGAGVRETEPTDEHELRQKLGIGTGPVVLSVSAKRTHKNLLRLVEAFARLRRSFRDAQLVLPGNPTQHEEELKAKAAALGAGEAVRFPAYVGEAELEGLYQLADVVAVPSVREGFGLPVLEAMQRGVPVACSNTSSLPEVGGDAVRYFDPFDPESIAGALRDLLENGALAQELVAKGLERARSFTWERTAQGTLESYERAMREVRPA